MPITEVPHKFRDLTTNDIQTGRAPSSTDWTRMAQNVAYLRGKESQLVPHCSFENNWGTFNNGDELILEVAVFPKKASIDRYWDFYVEAPGGNSRVEFTVNGVSGSFLLGPGTKLCRLREPVTSGSWAPVEFVGITASVYTSGMTIESLSAYELPRFKMDPEKDTDGVSWESSYLYRAPVYQDMDLNRSVTAVAYDVSSSVGEARKNGLYYHLDAWEVKGFENTLAFTFDNNVKDFRSLGIPLQGRRIYTTDDSCEVEVYCLMERTGGATPEVEMILSSSAGDGYVRQNLTTLNPTWVSGSFQVSIDALHGSGVPGTLTDKVKLRFRNRTETTDVRVYSVCIGEKHGPK